MSRPPPGRDPWSDPRTETEAGPPYAGPPVTGPPPPWPPVGYGVPVPYAYAPPGAAPPYTAWGRPVPPPPPRRPGQVVAAAVLAFVQAALVLIGSMYVFLLAALAGAAAGAHGFSRSRTEELASEGQILAAVQLLSAVALVVAGTMALTRRTRAAWVTLVAALGLQVALCLYWLVRVTGLVGSGVADGGVAGTVLVVASLMLAVGPLVGIALALTGAGRRWFSADAAA